MKHKTEEKERLDRIYDHLDIMQVDLEQVMDELGRTMQVIEDMLLEIEESNDEGGNDE